jgi:hypothetical protein
MADPTRASAETLQPVVLLDSDIYLIEDVYCHPYQQSCFNGDTLQQLLDETHFDGNVYVKYGRV